MSRGQLFRGSGPTRPPEKNRENRVKAAQTVHEVRHSYFYCHIADATMMISLEPLCVNCFISFSHAHLHPYNVVKTAGFDIPVVVHNAPRLVLKLIPQPYVSGTHAHTCILQIRCSILHKETVHSQQVHTL